MSVPKKITREHLDQLAAEIEADRQELNRFSSNYRSVNEDLLRLSEKLDNLIARHARLTMTFKKNKPSAM
ncbi:Spo0E family sporulation regulatory protein-aspartic acid phosphatase [Bacillus sp. FJAT-28004]|uniref:Spo0E family sporulation regulatory protein-aspartic acid phosphatase n=1 Tax=Bacillus sp. FJAT-28004 TaxID=1679165 RepID=UPI0006B4BAAD|nr:Spo0E family sporulation regulatory protein-aspartic acid phosphatase [Bacillus sp. FJAT-28004]